MFNGFYSLLDSIILQIKVFSEGFFKIQWVRFHCFMWQAFHQGQDPQAPVVQLCPKVIEMAAIHKEQEVWGIQCVIFTLIFSNNSKLSWFGCVHYTESECVFLFYMFYATSRIQAWLPSLTTASTRSLFYTLWWHIVNSQINCWCLAAPQLSFFWLTVFNCLTEYKL